MLFTGYDRAGTTRSEIEYKLRIISGGVLIVSVCAGLLDGPVLGHAGPGQVEPQGREQGHPGRRHAGLQSTVPHTS